MIDAVSRRRSNRMSFYLIPSRLILGAFSAALIATAIAAPMANAQPAPSADATPTTVSAVAVPPASAPVTAASLDPSRRAALVAAARADAVDRLLVNISAQRIDNDLTVGQFLDRTQSTPGLMAMLRSADQVGDPRWNDDGCEVRLDIAGSHLVAELTAIASSAGRASPRPPMALAAELDEWEQRTFTATGSAIVAERASDVPVPGIGMGSVGRPARRAAFAAARQGAIRDLLDRTAFIPFTGDQTFGQVMRDPAIGAPVTDWLQTRPVTQVEFLGSRQVQITLAVGGTDLAQEVLQSARDAHRPAPQGADAERFVAAIDQRVGLVRGWGAAPGSGPDGGLESATLSSGEPATQPTGQPTGQPTVQSAPPTPPLTPGAPPDWVNQQLVGQATALASQSRARLRVLSAAEDAAVANLRQSIEALPLPSGATIGQSEKTDRRVSQAVDRSLRHVEVAKVIYDPDGSVSVRVVLEAQQVWSDLVDGGYR
jgi:hypothetical protein